MITDSRRQAFVYIWNDCGLKSFADLVFCYHLQHKSIFKRLPRIFRNAEKLKQENQYEIPWLSCMKQESRKRRKRWLKLRTDTHRCSILACTIHQLSHTSKCEYLSLLLYAPGTVQYMLHDVLPIPEAFSNWYSICVCPVYVWKGDTQECYTGTYSHAALGQNTVFNTGIPLLWWF